MSISSDSSPNDRPELKALRSAAMDFAVDGMVITDPAQPDCPIIDCNQAFCDLTGYSRDEIIGRNCRFLQHGERNQEPLAKLAHDIEVARPTRVVVKNYRKDGTRFWNELSVSPVYDDNGKLTHFVGIQHDVTATVEARAELEMQMMMLKQVKREATIDMLERCLASAYLPRG